MLRRALYPSLHGCLRHCIASVLVITGCNLSLSAFSQSTNQGQFWNEFAFTRTLKGHWALQLDLGQRYSNSSDDKSILAYNTQLYARGWVHYFPGPKWKLSAAYSYHYSREVPELKQRKSPELRLSVQATYYFNRVNYTLTGRVRIEDRHVYNADSVFEAYYRFRTQLKYIQPLNAKRIRKGVVYAVSSEELMVKTNSKVAGNQFFDRNRFTLGMGYAFTDNLQLEVSYLNEYRRRDSQNEFLNALQVNVAVNNLLSNLRHKLFPND